MRELSPITRRQRLLAILVPHYQRADDHHVPACLTQTGIGEIMGLKNMQVSKELKVLADQGFVEVKHRFVTGTKCSRSMTVYVPTWKAVEYMRTVEAVTGIKIRDMPTVPVEFTKRTEKHRPYDEASLKAIKLEARFIAVEVD